MFKYYYLFNMIIERNINILIKCHDVYGAQNEAYRMMEG